MDIIRKIEFNPELQWATDMASPYVAAITNFIIREDNVKVKSIDNKKKAINQRVDSFIRYTEDSQNCHDLCLFFRQMGYIAYINENKIDHSPASVTVYNLPLTPRVFAFCNINNVLYLEYITPEKDRARIERWEKKEPAMRKFVKTTITRGEHEPWNEEDHCIIP